MAGITLDVRADVVDPALYREVMGDHPTGVAVVTGVDDGEPVGMVVGTFSAVSLDPPLVSFMPTVNSGTYARLAASPGIPRINVLAVHQLDPCAAGWRPPATTS